VRISPRRPPAGLYIPSAGCFFSAFPAVFIHGGVWSEGHGRLTEGVELVFFRELWEKRLTRLPQVAFFQYR
jgi:hypothetical protein